MYDDYGYIISTVLYGIFHELYGAYTASGDPDIPVPFSQSFQGAYAGIVVDPVFAGGLSSGDEQSGVYIRSVEPPVSYTASVSGTSDFAG